MTVMESTNKAKSRVLVTGASGFVGRKIIDALLLQDVEIIVVVRPASAIIDSHITVLYDVIYSDDIFFESVRWWTNVCKDVDVVIHAAWYAEPGKYLQSINNIDCLNGSLNLARGAALAKVKRFIGLGTCFEYEMSDAPLTVNNNQYPLTLYASSKLSLYFLLNQFFEIENIEFVWCRLFYLYGDGEDPRRFFPYLRQKLKQGEVAELTSGFQVRDYMDVMDAGRVIGKVALGSQCGVVNICSGQAVTIRQIAENIADEYGRRDLLKFGAREDNLVDPAFVVGVPNAT
jgi:nucleoside-diphosphate-sugar epimerase